MKVLIIYHSEHHGNTEKIAKAMGEAAADAVVSRAENINPDDLNEYDIIGLGSGVYNGRLHRELSEILDKLGRQEGRKAFIFSTTGSSTYAEMAHERFRPDLVEKGFEIMGEFSCPGFDTALTAEGINKGRPDQQDIEDARKFIRKLL